MINVISLRLLRNAEFLQFLDFIIKTIENNNPATLKVEAKLVALKNLYDQLDALFKQPQDSLLSDELMELDHKRDRAISGILQIVSANLNYFEQDRVHAAQLLDRNLRNYGSQIYNMNYQAESSTISSIIRDWETDTALESAIALLGLGGWKLELKQNNIDFIALYSDRNQEYGAETTDKTKEKRLDANTAYYDVTQLLNAYATIENTPAYQKTISEINALIESYNTLLRSRKAKQKQEE
jgi:hypothetical protein